jgi:hypothetical protein
LGGLYGYWDFDFLWLLCANSLAHVLSTFYRGRGIGVVVAGFGAEGVGEAIGDVEGALEALHPGVVEDLDEAGSVPRVASEHLLDEISGVDSHSLLEDDVAFQDLHQGFAISSALSVTLGLTRNGSCPCSISYSSTPRLHTSAFASYFCRWTISGAMYSIVPQNVFLSTLL